MMLQRIFILACIITAFAGCVDQVDLSEINGTPSRRIVVEGLITDEHKQQVVKLTRTNIAIPDSASDAVSGATLAIREGQAVYAMHEVDTLPGVYVTDDAVQGEIGKTYTLSIQFEGVEYTGSSTMQPVSDFTPEAEIFRAPNRLENPIPDNLEVFDLEFPKVRYGIAEPSRMIFYAVDPVLGTLRTAFYYEFPGVDPQGFLLNFQGHNEHIVVAEGTEILQVKYSITDENLEFMRSVYAQTDFRGGLFDRISANAPSNMSNGALGFFGASAVISRRFMFSKSLL